MSQNCRFTLTGRGGSSEHITVYADKDDSCDALAGYPLPPYRGCDRNPTQKRGMNLKVEASYSGIKKSLVEAISDPKRRRAESQIREPPDRIVLVEGRLDRFFFQENCEIDGLSFQTLGKGMARGRLSPGSLGKQITTASWTWITMLNQLRSADQRGSLTPGGNVVCMPS